MAVWSYDQQVAVKLCAMNMRLGTGMLCSKEPLSLSFSGSGFLAVYQLGVSQCFVDFAPALLHGAPHILGASAGSLVAAAVACGSSLGENDPQMAA
ncbi:transcription factor ETV7-like [Arapaima gigas]